MSGQIENISTPIDAASAAAAPVETPAPPVQPSPAPEAVQAPPQQPQYSPEMLAHAFSQAIQPLVPRPAEPTPIYETDDWLADRKSLKAGIEALIQQAIKGIDPRFDQFGQKLGIIEGLIPRLYARAAEKPDFGQVESKASELRKEFPNLDYLTSVQLAQKIAAAAPKPVAQPARIVPGFASGPNTSAQPARSGLQGGKADFADVIKSIRATHGDNVPDELLNAE